jgi:hypothetical protein
MAARAFSVFSDALKMNAMREGIWNSIFIMQSLLGRKFDQKML